MKISLVAILLFAIFSCTVSKQTSADKAYQGRIQQIPGRMQCEFYNEGGEGVAYHDSDSVNNGSGKLNPADGSFLNEFRMKEGVDISYTKSKDIDNNPYNKVAPQMEQLYVGWTEPGEWIKYSVNVNETGTYTLGIMYTANRDGAIALDVDGKKATEPLKISATFNDQEPIKWRQWHHWNKIESLGQIKLKKGFHVITLRTVETGNMNYDYIEFKKN